MDLLGIYTDKNVNSISIFLVPFSFVFSIAFLNPVMAKNRLLLPPELTQPIPVNNLKADLSLVLTNTSKILPKCSDHSNLSSEDSEIILNGSTELGYWFLLLSVGLWTFLHFEVPKTCSLSALRRGPWWSVGAALHVVQGHGCERNL